MKILFVDKSGDGGLDLAMRAIKAGHTVRYYLQNYDPVKRPIGKGLVPRVSEWQSSMRWADLVLLMGNDRWMLEMDRWRALGCRIIGGNAESAAWEIDRDKGMAVFKKAGIALPPYRSFTDYDAAIAYVKKQDRAFVSKPSGSCDDKSLSYVAKSPGDLVYMLERWKKGGKRKGLEFILQEKIDGVEAAVGAWFGPGGFADGWEENFEFKKMMHSDKGPNTGEMGTVMRYVAQSKLAKMMLEPVEDQLDALGYIGNVDVNCIIDEEGTPWPLEFTMRFGYPAINIETSLFSMDPMEFLAGLAAGKPPAKAHKLNDVAVGVVMAIPPFPFEVPAYKEVVGVPLYGMTESLAEHVHPCEMMQGAAPHSDDGRIENKPCLVTAGDYVLVATGTGPSVQDAARRAYQTLNRLDMPASPFYRTDIGRRLSKQLPELQRHGFNRGMRYAS